MNFSKVSNFRKAISRKTMKKYIFILLLLAPIVSLFAQEDGIKKNQVGLLSNTFVLWHNGSRGGAPSYDFHFMTGIYYKHYFSKNGLRFSVRKISDECESIGSYSSKGEYYEKRITVGYERIFRKQSTAKLTPFIAMDLVFVDSFDEGSEGGGIWANAANYKIKRNGFGLSPSVGVGYKIIENFSADISIQWDIVFANYESEIIETSFGVVGRQVKKETDRIIELTAVPTSISLSIGYSF